MNFEQFKQEIMNGMAERFPELEIESQTVNKLQGQSYEGISVRSEGSNIAATMNIQPVFEQVKEGMPMELAMDRVAEMIEQAAQSMPEYDLKTLSDYSKMKDTLILQLIPISGNEERLADIPHKVVDEMALVYRMELEQTDQGAATILVNNQLLRNYGIDQTQLHEDAVEAAVRNHPATLRNMNDVMRDMMGDLGNAFIPDEPSPLWVASIEGGMHGACAIQYPDFLDQAAETLGGDFFVLPSSQHEVLLVPDDGSMELGQLEQMVHDVNEAEVAPEDRLSDHVFHYDSEAHIFENARTFEERGANMEEAMLADAPAPGMTAPETMTVLLVEPSEHPRVVEVGTGLEELQAAVGGDIEVVYPFEDTVGLIMNEEGKINGLPLNRALRDENGEVYDVIAGSFLVVGLTEDSFGSLSQEQVGKFEEIFHQPEAFVKMGRNIMAIPIPEETLEAREAAKAKTTEEISARPKHKKPDHDGH